MTPFQVTFDAADPDRLAAFWAIALDYIPQPPPEGFDSWPAFLSSIGVPEEAFGTRAAIVNPAGDGPRVFFQQVPEPKTAKNRVHLDVNAAGGHGADPDGRRERVDAKVRQLEGAGGSVARVVEEQGERWVVMADPEGNEFCVQ